MLNIYNYKFNFIHHKSAHRKSFPEQYKQMEMEMKKSEIECMNQPDHIKSMKMMKKEMFFSSSMLPQGSKHHTEQNTDSMTSMKGHDSATSTRKRDSPKKSFPEVLMSILDREDTKHAICWASDGNSFTIQCPNTFTLQVLPRHFKPTEFSTFTRRLYWWGFKKTATRSSEKHSFHHELFKRGDYEMCRKISGFRASTKKEQNLKRKAQVEEIPVPQVTCTRDETLTQFNIESSLLPAKRLKNISPNFAFSSGCSLIPKLSLLHEMTPFFQRNLLRLQLQDEIRELRKQIRQKNQVMLHMYYP